MGVNLTTGEIAYFDKYYFTDIANSKPVPHFATVLLPTKVTGFQNSILCAVMTSRETSDKTSVSIETKDHPCLSTKTYICFKRRDYECIDDLDSKKRQPVGKLNETEVKKCWPKLKDALYADIKLSPYTRGTIIREWKKILPPK